MDHAFEFILAVCVAIFLYIVGPIYDRFQAIDKAIDDHVNVVTNSFQKVVRTNGYVDLKTYNSFLSDLSKTKKVYKVELIHSKKAVYPKGTGDFQILYVDHGNTEIFKTIKDNKKYLMNYGDNFVVIVKDTEGDSSSILMNRLIGNTGASNKHIFARYGGMIENTDLN